MTKWPVAAVCAHQLPLTGQHRTKSVDSDSVDIVDENGGKTNFWEMMNGFGLSKVPGGGNGPKNGGHPQGAKKTQRAKATTMKG